MLSYSFPGVTVCAPNPHFIEVVLYFPTPDLAASLHAECLLAVAVIVFMFLMRLLTSSIPELGPSLVYLPTVIAARMTVLLLQLR